MDKELKVRFKPKTKSKGYVTVEYAIVTGFLIAAIILPIPGVGESMVDLVLNAIQHFQSHTTTMLALP